MLYNIPNDGTTPIGLKERTIGGVHSFLLRHLVGLPEIPTSPSFLDLGCGTGAWLERLALLGLTDLLGVDRDGSAFGASSATFVKGDLDSEAPLKLGARKFDIVTSIEVIEHLANPGCLLAHASNYMKADGVFILTTPNIHSVLCRLRYLVTGKMKQFDEKGDIGHTTPILLPGIQKMLARRGMAIVHLWEYPENGGTITSRFLTKSAAALAKRLFPLVFEGDNLCVVIKKTRCNTLG
jgi:SAM-dependent methyltransferase